MRNAFFLLLQNLGQHHGIFISLSVVSTLLMMFQSHGQILMETNLSQITDQ